MWLFRTIHSVCSRKSCLQCYRMIMIIVLLKRRAAYEAIALVSIQEWECPRFQTAANELLVQAPNTVVFGDVCSLTQLKSQLATGTARHFPTSWLDSCHSAKRKRLRVCTTWVHNPTLSSSSVRTCFFCMASLCKEQCDAQGKVITWYWTSNYLLQ